MVVYQIHFNSRWLQVQSPIAEFDFKQPPYCDDKLIPFRDLSQVEFGTVNEWNWVINGNTITAHDDLFQQQLPIGLSNISLAVKNKEGYVSETASKTVTIGEHPEINITGEPEGCKNELLPFNSINTNSSVPISNWYWNFGDDNAGSSSYTSHAFRDTGAYNVQVYAQAENGCPSDTLQTQVTILALMHTQALIPWWLSASHYS